MGNYQEAAHYAERALSGRRLHFALLVLLASLGQLGRTVEAREVVIELVQGKLSDTEGYWQFVYPYAQHADRANFVEGLRKAG
jgi:hypothetical protein